MGDSNGKICTFEVINWKALEVYSTNDFSANDTTNLQLRQDTSEPSSPRNQLTKTEAKVVSGRFSGESVIEISYANLFLFLSSGIVYQTRLFPTLLLDLCTFSFFVFCHLC